MKSIGPFIIIAVCIGAYFFYISPKIAEIRALSAEKSQYNNVLQKSKELKDKRDSVLVDYNNIPKDSIDRLSKIIPETFEPVLFANDINALAQKYGLTIRDLQVNTLKTEVRDPILSGPGSDAFKTSLVSLRLGGNYAQFGNFLKDLETSLRLIDVRELSIRNLSTQSVSDTALEYTLELHTYSLR